MPHSEISGSPGASPSPEHFAAWLRPSSAAGAKASTVRPFLHLYTGARASGRLRPPRGPPPPRGIAPRPGSTPRQVRRPGSFRVLVTGAPRCARTGSDSAVLDLVLWVTPPTLTRPDRALYAVVRYFVTPGPRLPTLPRRDRHHSVFRLPAPGHPWSAAQTDAQDGPGGQACPPQTAASGSMRLLNCQGARGRIDPGA